MKQLRRKNAFMYTNSLQSTQDESIYSGYQNYSATCAQDFF